MVCSRCMAFDVGWEPGKPVPAALVNVDLADGAFCTPCEKWRERFIQICEDKNHAAVAILDKTVLAHKALMERITGYYKDGTLLDAHGNGQRVQDFG